MAAVDIAKRVCTPDHPVSIAVYTFGAPRCGRPCREAPLLPLLAPRAAAGRALRIHVRARFPSFSACMQMFNSHQMPRNPHWPKALQDLEGLAASVVMGGETDECMPL